MKDTKAQSTTPPAAEIQADETLAAPTPPAAEIQAAAGEEPSAFSERQALLNTRLAELAADFHALLSDIKTDGTYYEGFRKIKETYFRLQVLAARNGSQSERKPRTSTPPSGLFERGTQQPETSERRKSSAPPSDLFERVPRREDVAPPKISNPERPNLFMRTAPPPPPAIVRKGKLPAPPDAKRKVLADSEENED